MKMACQTITWSEGNRNMPHVMKEVRAAGFDGLEIGARHLNPVQAGEYRDLLAANALTLVALHVGGDFLNADSVKRQMENLPKTLALARGLGAGFVLLSSGAYGDGGVAAYAAAAANYNELGKMCASEGLKLCYHNHDWEMKNGGVGWRTLIEHTRAELVSFAPDVGWVTRGGADPVCVVSELYDRIALVHFKEFTADGKITELGRGMVNFRGVYDILKRKGEQFWFVAEQDVTETTPRESAAQNARYLKSLVK